MWSELINRRETSITTRGGCLAFFTFLLLSSVQALGASSDEPGLDTRWEAFPIDIIGADGTINHSNLRAAAVTLGSRGERITSAVKRAAAGVSDEQLSQYLNGLRKKSIVVDGSGLRLHEMPPKTAALDLRYEDLFEAQVDLLERLIATGIEISKAAPPLTASERATLEQQVSKVCLELKAMYARPEAEIEELRVQEWRRLVGITSTAPAASQSGPTVAKLTAFLTTLPVSMSAPSMYGWVLRPISEQKLETLGANMRSTVSLAEAIEKSKYSEPVAGRAEKMHAAMLAARANASGPVFTPTSFSDSYGVQVRLFMQSFSGYSSSMDPELGQRLESLLKTQVVTASENVRLLQKKYGLEEASSKPASATSQPS